MHVLTRNLITRSSILTASLACATVKTPKSTLFRSLVRRLENLQLNTQIVTAMMKKSEAGLLFPQPIDYQAVSCSPAWWLISTRSFCVDPNGNDVLVIAAAAEVGDEAHGDEAKSSGTSEGQTCHFHAGVE